MVPEFQQDVQKCSFSSKYVLQTAQRNRFSVAVPIHTLRYTLTHPPSSSKFDIRLDFCREQKPLYVRWPESHHGTRQVRRWQQPGHFPAVDGSRRNAITARHLEYAPEATAAQD
jgi:hypothetical protein